MSSARGCCLEHSHVSCCSMPGTGLPCLLWAPALGSKGWEPVKLQPHKHRLAELRHGMHEGLVSGGCHAASSRLSHLAPQAGPWLRQVEPRPAMATRNLTRVLWSRVVTPSTMEQGHQSAHTAVGISPEPFTLSRKIA